MRGEVIIVIVLSILDLAKKLTNLLFPGRQSDDENQDG